MELEEEIDKLTKEQKAMESSVALLTSQIQGLQNKIAELNKDYVKNEGKLELLEELQKEEKT